MVEGNTGIVGALNKEEEEAQGATIPLMSLVKKGRIIGDIEFGNGGLVGGTLFGDVVDGHRAWLTRLPQGW